MSERTDRFFAACACHDRLVITGHDTPDCDSIICCELLRRLLAFGGVAAQIVLPTAPDEQSLRVLGRFGIEPARLRGEISEGDALVLADHHQQQHPGVVAAIVDHHPTDSAPDAPFVCIEPCGAAASIALALMREAGMPVTHEEEALTVAALYLDTLALRSPKILPQEAQWARETAGRLRMDEAWLTREGLWLEDMSRPAMELAAQGKKIYRFGEKTVVSTALQTDEMTPERLDAILQCTREMLMQSGAALWVFLHHDPVHMRTTQYDLTPDGRVTRIAHDGLVSRGKTVMPRVEREIRKIK